MYYKSECKKASKQLDKKTAEKLQILTIIRLIDKFMETGIEDNKIGENILEIIESLNKIKNGDKSQIKAYKTKYKNLTDYAQKEYGLIAKGFYPAIYLSLGLAIGAGLGVALMSAVNTAFLAVGIGAGLSVGLAIGATKENKAKQEGKLY